MDDLDAAKLDDVKGWFQAYYGPSNAVLVIAGDVDAKTAREKVERYFGDIPAGPPVARQGEWIAKRTGRQRGVMQDRVPQTRIYKVWNVPPWGAPDADYLSLAASALSSGKSSRFYKRLVFDEQIATDVDASVELREIGGLFVVEAGVRRGVEPAKVERALDQELARFLAAGPTPVELRRAQTLTRADFIRGVERIGGFGGKSDVLAKGEVFAGRPDFYKVQLARVAAATGAQIRAASARWLAAASTPSRCSRSRTTPRRLPPSIARSSLSPGRRREPNSPPSSAIRCRTASRSCSPSAGRSPRCGSTSCSMPDSRPISSPCRAPPASR
jgi:Predicted Zn-dependent peptidases